MTDDVHGDELPESTQQVLRALTDKATPADCRRAYPQCTHPVERRQRYTNEKDYCQVCGRPVPR